MKNKSKNNKIIFYLINITVIVLVSWMSIFSIIKENGMETFSYIKNISVISLLILTFIFFLNYFMEGIVIATALKEYKSDFTPSQGFVIQSIGGLFSAITPMKIGYLPSIGYAYSRFNVKGIDVIKSMVKTTYTFQIFNFIINLISLMVCCYKEMIITVADANLNLKYIAIVGIIYNGIIMFGYFLLILSPKIHEVSIKLASWLLYKIKKIDNRSEFESAKIEKMAITRNEIKHFLKDIKQFSKLLGLYTLKYFIYGSLPYVIFLLLSKENFNIEIWLYTLVLRNLISYITSIVPIPGASGAAELAFVATFSLVFSPEPLLNSIMLLWRMFTYFMNIIIGFATFLILSNVKKRAKSNN